MARPSLVEAAAWPSVTLEGALIAPAMLARIAAPEEAEETRRSYRIRKGLTLREEISTAYRVAQAHYDAFAKREAPSAEATRRFLRDLLKEAFGFDDLEPGEGAAAFFAGGRVPVVVVSPADEKLDRRSAALVVEGRTLSPAFALQDLLNAGDLGLWGLASNGVKLRLLRADASLTRPSYVEADLAQIFTTEDAASFALLWLLLHRTRFGDEKSSAADCALERWREAGAREGEAARDRLAGQVEQALRLLGAGFLEADPALSARLRSGEADLTQWFNELLRLVYRLIFLMAAEDRDLLHPEKATPEARALYREGYSLTLLRERAARAVNWDRHHDRYEGVKILFRALAQGEEALGLPALGGLFAADQLPNLEGARMRNRAFLGAIYELSWLRGAQSVVPVNWRAMRTEELGSVYESLLELQPQLSSDGRSLLFASDSVERKGNQRKTTGSYYTPDSLIQALLDSALDPVLARIEAQEENPAEALLNLTVIDPACGSGHALLAAARRIATRVARLRTDGTPSAEEFRHALREAARRCVYGVDRNPMAVELAKVALWIETVDPGRPLGFFDAQIRCGDALLGLFDLSLLDSGIPDAAYKPLTGDDKTEAKYLLKANQAARKGQGGFDFAQGGAAAPSLAPIRAGFKDLRLMPEGELSQVQARAAQFAALRASEDFRRLEAAADLYMAAFLLPKRDSAAASFRRSVPTTEDLRAALAGGLNPAMASSAASAASARRARALHWPLEFPDAMEAGGFDVVIGNPPWDVVQLSEQEYFASRKPEIAALSGDARKQAIEGLATSDPAAYLDFAVSKRFSEANNEFAREGGRFALTARGKVNTYALFAEFMGDLSRRRTGVIVPTGIATDATTAPFFADLVERRRLARLVDFENREKLFPAVDSRMKFCLMTLGREEPQARFAFFLTDPAQLADPERNFILTPQEIARLNPNTRTAPIFRSRADAELTTKIYARVPILVEEARGAAGNPWSVEFRQGLFNMTSDSALFRTARQLAEAGWRREGTDWIFSGQRPAQGSLDVEGAEARSLPLAGGGPRQRRYVPLYEAKMIHQFDHRWAGYDEAGESASDFGPEQKRDPQAEPAPRYWVPHEEVEARLKAKDWERGWLMGWRDIARATDERTTIMSLIPRCAVGHTTPLMFADAPPEKWAPLLANLNSLTLDYCARQAVGGTHLTYGYLKQFPILPPGFYEASRLGFVAPRVLELTYTSHSMAPFARDLGYEGKPFPWDEERRALLRAELDAFYARAYGLTRDELRYVLDPAEVKGADYPSESFRVLKEKEIRSFGEFRTRRLVLEAWDRMEAQGDFRAMGL